MFWISSDLVILQSGNLVIGTPTSFEIAKLPDYKMSHLLLATDTSGKNGSLALARVTPGQSGVEIVEVVPLAGGAFSAQLVPQIAALLEKHGHNKNHLGAFAVASGPGSFTGLRVGLAAIKALAEALQKPIAAVSLLEAVACSGAGHSRVLAALDAGRGDVYVGDYELGPRARRPAERLLSREEFLVEASRPEVSFPEAKRRSVLTPDAMLAETVRTAGIQVERIEYPNSAVIARLGWERIQRGETVRPEELEANYIRRSDAEMFSKPAS
jgi:tRNA threonylcarbamoyladenosine biosynthesis protein TsaB